MAADLYALLGVARSATKQEISKGYKRQALLHHPDKAAECDRPAATERFRQIALAYEVLRDDVRRDQYDLTGEYDDTPAAVSEYDTFVDSFFGEHARAVDGRSPDWSIHSLLNYDRLTLKEGELPPHLKDIAMVGLSYLACVVEDLAVREVALLRHQRVDILYIMVAFEPPLSQAAFDQGYIIHYYDNPLQAGIYPAWSDQNQLDGKSTKATAEIRSRRVLSQEQYTRRQDIARAALTAGGGDPLAALEERYYNNAPEHVQKLRDKAGGGSKAEAVLLNVDPPVQPEPDVGEARPRL